MQSQKKTIKAKNNENSNLSNKYSNSENGKNLQGRLIKRTNLYKFGSGNRD